MLPSPSSRESPSVPIALAMVSVGFAMLVSKVRSAVPAEELFTPAFAISPSAVATSSTL